MPSSSFLSGDVFSRLYNIVYNMSTQRGPNNHSIQLYDRFGEFFVGYIDRHVLHPLLEICKDESVDAQDYLIAFGTMWVTYQEFYTG